MVLGLLLTLSVSLADTKSFDVAIISSGNNQVYSRIINIITNTTKKSHPHISFRTFYADSFSSVNNKINDANLLVTIGKRAMIVASQLNISPPILATLVPQQSFEKYHSTLTKANSKVTAIYIDSTPRKQVMLAKLLLGNLQTVGILLSDNLSPKEQQLAAIVKHSGLKPNILKVSPTDNIIRKLSRLIGSSDVLLAIPDPLIFNRNTARNILLTTYRQRVPVIGFSSNYVKAGALAAVFSTPGQIARQTATTILGILDSSLPFPSRGSYPNEFNVSVNSSVARSLGISTPPIPQIKQELKKLLVEFK